MKVPGDLKNVYVWADARQLLPFLSNLLMQEGKRGRKFNVMTLGDAASVAIIEACERRGVVLTPAAVDGMKVEQVPVVNVRGKVKAK